MNTLFRIIGAFFNSENYTLKNLAFYLLVIMSIQFIPLESRAGVSPIKVATMVFMPLILFTHFKLSKAVGIAFIYMTYIIFTAYFFHEETFRASTVIYMFMFFITYATFYNLIWVEEAIEMEEFIVFVKRFIYVLVCFLILQQICQILGIKNFPLINLLHDLRRGVLAGNSLSYEPSTLARSLGVLYYAYLKCHEYKQGRAVNIQQIFNNEHRWITAAYLWSMFTMGSGTAFICLGVISLYFMRGAYFVFVIPIFFAVYSVLNFYEIRQFKRATEVVEATTTLDADEVRETDGSAAVRIAPMLNTINHLDIESGDTWFGHGVDYSYNVARKKGMRMMGEIDDYGIISYLLNLVLIFSCAIDFFSLATVMYFLGIGGGTSNIAYGWGLLMIFTCVKYFHHLYRTGELEQEEEQEQESIEDIS